jgi:peptide chain release factor 3
MPDGSAHLPRRTFAIISHPDAGKTTLTEKLLLYGGAVGLAGTVTARKDQRATASDWMELEKQRGISISSTVLQFDYGGYRINLLDTPGHKDFSEDTYRVLTAVDAAVMVIDAGKGIEPQTRKLFEVCRMRGVPIFTFFNKCDRPTREPLALLDELESILGIGAFPMDWPIGSGPEFRGVYERRTRRVHLFERTPGGAYAAPVESHGLDDPSLDAKIDADVLATARDEIAMLEGAGESYDAVKVLDGKMTPAYFGSAMNNFGVQLLLDGFLAGSSGPRARRTAERTVEPTEPKFSGFVFKIQANMDPKHRDRIAFIRVVSGTFRRDMTVTHVQGDRKIRLSSAQRLFGQSRETIDEGEPGDIVGIVGHDRLGIGDTLAEDRTVAFDEIPRFPPEVFAVLYNPQPANSKKFRLGIGDTLAEDRTVAFDEIPRFPPEVFAVLYNPQPANSKKFRLGVEQLLQEGVVQMFKLGSGQTEIPLLAAVGPLQFEVFAYRLKAEYGAESRLEPSRWNHARWFVDPEFDPESIPMLGSDVAIARDPDERKVLLFADEWGLRYFQQKNPKVELSNLPPRKLAAEARY